MLHNVVSFCKNIIKRKAVKVDSYVVLNYLSADHLIIVICIIGNNVFVINYCRQNKQTH